MTVALILILLLIVIPRGPAQSCKARAPFARPGTLTAPEKNPFHLGGATQRILHLYKCTRTRVETFCWYKIVFLITGDMAPPPRPFALFVPREGPRTHRANNLYRNANQIVPEQECQMGKTRVRKLPPFGLRDPRRFRICPCTPNVFDRFQPR